jgi:hypothetical protein
MSHPLSFLHNDKSNEPHNHSRPARTDSHENGPTEVPVFRKHETSLEASYIPNAADRRAALRYRSRSVRVVLSWMGEDGRVECIGKLRDISMGGAQVAVDRFPPEAATLWMRLASGDPNLWVEVVNLGPPPGGREQRLRLAFPSGCPYHIFRRSVWGHDSDEVDAQEMRQRSRRFQR